MSRPIFSIRATKGDVAVKLHFHRSQNSLGEPDIFIGKRPPKGFEELHGWPLYAARVWLIRHGYKIENFSSGYMV